MKRWVQAMKQKNLEADGTLKAGPYGDWCDTYSMDGKCGDGGKTPQNLIATAYHYNNCRIMARAAKRLKKPEDAKLFDEWADQLKQAFNKKFRIRPPACILAEPSARTYCPSRSAWCRTSTGRR